MHRYNSYSFNKFWDSNDITRKIWDAIIPRNATRRSLKKISMNINFRLLLLKPRNRGLWNRLLSVISHNLWLINDNKMTFKVQQGFKDPIEYLVQWFDMKDFQKVWNEYHKWFESIGCSSTSRLGFSLSLKSPIRPH